MKIVLAVATFAYLALELAFNARLLDVAGDRADVEVVHALEFYGRTISAFGFAMIAWRWLIVRAQKNGKTFSDTAPALLLAGLLLIPAVYFGQKILVDALVARSDGDQRKLAAYLTYASKSLAHGIVKLDGLDLPPEEMSSPSGKTLIALFGVMAYSAENAMAVIDHHLEPIAVRIAKEVIGPPEAIYNDHYVPASMNLREQYAKYAAGSLKADKAYQQWSAEADRKWKQYQAKIRPHGRRVHTPAGQRRVVSELHREGVMVPANFRPNDQQAFRKAVETSYRTQALSEFRRELDRQTGRATTMPAGLNWPDFIGHADIQGELKRQFQTSRKISMDWQFDQFVQDYYNPLVSERVADQLSLVRAGAAELAEDGSRSEQGRNFMRGLIVPPIALAFSLAGGLMNVLGLAQMLCGPLKRRRGADPGLAEASEKTKWFILVGAGLKCCIVASIVAVPFFVADSVADSDLFHFFKQETERNTGLPATIALEWIIRAQPMMYPMNDLVRRSVLGGFDFS